MQTVAIDGMKCSGCASTVLNALELDNSIIVEQVNVENGTATFRTDTKKSVMMINQLLKETKYSAIKEITE